jgi:hypothetical protein
MNIERLNRQVAILEALKVNPPDNMSFDMALWINACGTTCCAIGYAALDVTMRREGLKLIMREPHYMGFIGFTAVAKFYDISEDDAVYLFSAECYGDIDTDEMPDPTIDQVIDRIKTYMK